MLRFAVYAAVLLSLMTPPASAADRVRVHVTSNGWHTGIVVAYADIPTAALPEARDFPQASFLEFGWGDADYYPARDPGVFDALGAAFASSASVVHLAGLPAHPRQVFPESETVALDLTEYGFRALIAYLDAAFDRGGAAQAPPAADGLYSFSRFYPGHGRFSLSNTCNTWVARALATAGLPVEPDGVVRAADVMRQLHPISASHPSGTTK